MDSLQVANTSAAVVGVGSFGTAAMAAAAGIAMVGTAATAAIVEQMGRLLTILLYIVKD